MDSFLYKNIHALLVMQCSEILVEKYFSGHDECWGSHAGMVNFNAGSLHDIRSVTKSIVSLLYGVAIKKCSAPALTTSLVSAFPEFDTHALNREIMIENALTMTMGLAWYEDVPYTDGRNDEIRMEAAEDRYGYILSKPVLAAPGVKWNYSGGATALLGGIIERCSEMPLSEFARQNLFKPLGIDNVHWYRGGDGMDSAASGLRMSARDLLKIGSLILSNGIYDGKAIIPASWSKAMLLPRVNTGDEYFRCYGYHWFISYRHVNALNRSVKCVVAIGNGGQVLLLCPELEAVVVVFSGEYNNDAVWRKINNMLDQYIIWLLV